MKRAQYAERGPVPQDVVEAVDAELPPPRPGQALVAVLAAPINPSDLLQLTGQYGILPPLPATPGNEGVGRVLALGPHVENVHVGQVVLLPAGSGTWTTQMIADAASLLPLPSEADPRQLSMLTVNPPTAWLLLTEIVDLEPGDWVIQNAANSAVGGYLVQIAKHRGLKLINVVRRESAVAAVKELGAEYVLVDGEDLPRRVKEITGGAKVALGIDAVGGAATERLAHCVGRGATVVNYGAMSGEVCHASPADIIFRDVRLRGFWVSAWYGAATPQRKIEVLGKIAQLIASGELSAKVQATYPIERIKEAVAAAAAGERDGKILLVP